MRKLLAVVLAAFLLIPVLAACGEEPAGSDWETVEKTKLTVYMGGNEGNNARDNQEVAEALAKKFYEDTGNAVELDFTIYSDVLPGPSTPCNTSIFLKTPTANFPSAI